MSNPVTWFEVHTADPDRAKGFYGQLFGWTFTEEAPGYTMIGLGPDAPIGGGIAAGRPGQPPLAVFLVQVADVAAVCAAAAPAGGGVALSPQTTPTGLRFAYLTDPDGSTFGIWTPPPTG